MPFSEIDRYATPARQAVMMRLIGSFIEGAEGLLAAGVAPEEIAGDNGETYFWGLDNRNNAVKWVKGSGEEVWVLTKAGLRKEGDGPQQYIPLRKGLLRLDPGKSLQYGRPVAVTLLPRIRNTLILAGVAFIVVMPLALLLGIIAGINDRIASASWISGSIALKAATLNHHSSSKKYGLIASKFASIDSPSARLNAINA